MPAELQPKLLRVQQEQELERLGGIKSIQVDVRLVAATNHDLSRMVAQGRFRADLYYLLNVFPVVLPPLRERAEDVPRLVRHFTQKFARRMSRWIEPIPAEVMEALTRYPWPGNVRKLQRNTQGSLRSAWATCPLAVAARTASRWRIAREESGGP